MLEDLALLPASVLATARLDANGEVAWPRDKATEAINALADVGLRVLGLDLRQYDEDRRILEVAWSALPGSLSINEGRAEALAALRRPDLPPGFDWVLVTWDRPGGR